MANRVVMPTVTRNLRRWLVVIVAVTSLFAAVVPATADHDPAVPLRRAAAFDTGGWAAHRVSVPPGATIEIDASPTVEDSRRTASGAWLLNPDGSLVIAFLVTGYSGAVDETHVEAAGQTVVSERSGGSSGTGGASVRWTLPNGGEYIALGVATSDLVQSAAVDLYASPEVALLGSTQDDNTFVLAESDFSGTANITASRPCVAGIAPLCPYAKALVDQSLTRTLDHRFFGNFVAGAFDPAMARSREGPEGSGDSIGSGGIVFTGAAPGDYRFTVDSNVGGPLSGLAVWGFGARLPWPLTIGDQGLSPSALAVDQGWLLEIRNETGASRHCAVDDTTVAVEVPAGAAVGLPIDLPVGEHLLRCDHAPESVANLMVAAA